MGMTRRHFETSGRAASDQSCRRGRFRAVVWAIVASIVAANGSLRAQSSGEYDRPGKNPHQSRSAVIAKHGIVCCAQPLAAEVGLDVLKAGGNAADAAIA